MAEILVVDDEIGIRELLSEILGDEGHAVTLADSAITADDLEQAGGQRRAQLGEVGRERVAQYDRVVAVD